VKIIAALTVPVMAVGLGTLVASPASAHTPNFSASCDGVHLGATAYDGGMANRWSVTIGGVTQTGTFGSSVDKTFAVPQEGATTSWSASVEAEDGTYHFDDAGSVGPCGAPTDVCADLPGNQPAGTECTPPPDVERSDTGSLNGCDVSFGGTEYGPGDLAYEKQYTDTYVFNEATNLFQLVTDTTPTIANIVFVPWTVGQQIKNDCFDRAPKPGAKVTQDQSSRTVCADNQIVTTTVTTRTPYVYDADTNKWVPGKPVKSSTTTSKPAKPGVCSDVAASHASLGNTGATPAVAGSSDSSSAAVPTAVDAGLAGAAPVATTSNVSAAAFSSASSTTNDTRVPALLLVLTGLAFAAGAFRIRRS
jgi:hypothetical protein